MNVLVCDDDAVVRALLKRLLVQHFTCTVHQASDGQEGLAQLAATHFDLLILDLDMPRVGGIQVLEALRKLPDTKDLCIIMLSSERRREVVAPLLQLGIADYIVKPLRPESVQRMQQIVRALPCQQPATAAPSFPPPAPEARTA